MSSDAEVQELRARTHCAVVLEKLADGWKLDGRESTRHCLKYRRGPGEILIVNHGGRGWWDPQMRGPKFRGFTVNGTKTLFRLPGSNGRIMRIALGEGPITMASLAALERLRADTLYAATGGGMGPETIAAIEALLQPLAGDPGASLVSAADNDAAGERHAARHWELAAKVGVRFERLRPPDGMKDWNDLLKRRRK